MKFNEKNPEQRNGQSQLTSIYKSRQPNHINVAGGGVVKYARIKLMPYLLDF